MAAIAVVQKMSRLISSLHIWLVDVESGQHHATDGLTLAGRPPRSSLPRARSPASAPRFDPWQNRPDRPASRHSRRGRDLRELLIWAAILALLALVYANHGRFLEIG
jgi:hypothetical protein